MAGFIHATRRRDRLKSLTRSGVQGRYFSQRALQQLIQGSSDTIYSEDQETLAQV